MAFSPAFLDELNARNPIEDVVGQYVALTKRGNNLFGLCPFHSEKTPSFSVAPDKGIYYCFGCHKGGGAVNFILEIENLSYPDAIRFLAKRAGMEVPEDDEYQSQFRKKERLWALCRDAARFFHAQLKTPQAAEARKYIAKRGLSDGAITRFGIGFAPDSWTALTDAMTAKGYTKSELLEAGLVRKSEKNGSIYDWFRNKLIFPIIDVRGNVIGFGGRVLDNSKPKYINSPESALFSKRRNLFAMNFVKKSKQGYIILTEGYMDTVTLHQYGFDCAVASLGTSLTQEHADLLSKYTKEIVLIYDGDAAGQNAIRRAIPILEKTGLRIKILRMQGAKDPDEYLHEYGADRFKLLLQGSEGQAEYRLQSLQMQFDLTQDEQKVEFAKQAAELICTFSTAVEREIYGTRAAEAAGLTPEVMKLEISKAFKRRMARQRKEQEKRELAPSVMIQPKSRELRYQNVRSAAAEEELLRMLLKEPELFAKAESLTAEAFSVPFFGRVFDFWRQRWRDGLPVTAAGLESLLTAEELAHLTSVLQKQDSPVSDEAFEDCRRIVLEESVRGVVSDADGLRAVQQSLKKKKGYGGT